MKNKFPYKGNIVTVTKDMCDMNGHMNVSYYSKVFDEGGFELYKDLGFSWDNETIRSEFSTFTLEENIRYLKENFKFGVTIISTKTKIFFHENFFYFRPLYFFDGK